MATTGATENTPLLRAFIVLVSVCVYASLKSRESWIVWLNPWHSHSYLFIQHGNLDLKTRPFFGLHLSTSLPFDLSPVWVGQWVEEKRTGGLLNSHRWPFSCFGIFFQLILGALPPDELTLYTLLTEAYSPFVPHTSYPAPNKAPPCSLLSLYCKHQHRTGQGRSPYALPTWSIPAWYQTQWSPLYPSALCQLTSVHFILYPL